MFKKWGIMIRRMFAIKGGTDVQGTIDEIRKNIALRSANVWMLICSAILACIGLDTNSIAVIIGAMLISPLMSPILGIGLGVAILDREMLKSALANLGLATFITLATSSLYFFLTPLGELTPELSARTMPTMLDVGVAFFGGVAGIVAGSRRNKTNAIPGVAIATALMPPLCTVGFGLVNFDSSIFLGSLYLYFINAFFISLATMLVVTWLKFPKRTKLDEEQNTRVKQVIIGFAVLVLIPSVFILFNVLQKARNEKAVRDFVTTEIRSDNRQPLRWDLTESGGVRRLKIYCVGNTYTAQEKNELSSKLPKYGLGDVELGIVDMNVLPDEVQNISKAFESTLTENFQVISAIDEDRLKEMSELRAEIDKLKQSLRPENIFLSEAAAKSGAIKSLYWDSPATTTDETTSKLKRRLIISFKDGTEGAIRTAVDRRIRELAISTWPDDEIEITQEKPAQPTPQTEEQPDEVQ